MVTSIRLCQTPQEFDAWDNFVLRFPGAHYCQLYGWLSSYEAMGFDCEVIVQSKGDQIVEGAAFVSIKLPFGIGRVFILPHGPLSKKPGDQSWDILMEALDAHFRRNAAVYVQAWPPVAREDLSGLESFLKAGYQGPALFTSHRFSSTLLAIDLIGRTEEEILTGFRPDTRRHYRKSLRSGLELYLGQSLEDLRRSYDLMEENGRYHGYQPRPYRSLAIVFEQVVKKGRGMLLQVWKGNDLVGTMLVLFAGRIATYYAGATRRDFGRLYPAEFMHMSAMRLAKDRDIEVYDLMNWVSDSVAVFKRGFRPQERCWTDPRTKIFKPRLAQCLSWGENQLRPLVRQLVGWKTNRRSRPRNMNSSGDFVNLVRWSSW